MWPVVGYVRHSAHRPACRVWRVTAISPRSERPTTLAFVTLTEGQARYALYDENSAMRMLRAADLPVLGINVTALLFGGISLVP